MYFLVCQLKSPFAGQNTEKMVKMTAKTTSVLFVCLGNICRSPTAEAVFKHKARQLALDVDVDSAGTMGYHTGSPPDQRSRAVGEARGYDFSGISCRRIQSEDFETFDFIIAMDAQNLQDLKDVCPAPMRHKLHLFMQFSERDDDEVPDPYYGGAKGFEYVLDLIEDASHGLVRHLQLPTR